MRRPFAVLSLLVCSLAIAPIAVHEVRAAQAGTAPARKPAARPAAGHEVSAAQAGAPAVVEQRAKVEQLAKAQLHPAYPEALVELAHRYRAARKPKEALSAMVAAAEAFDKQVEIHKNLSEVVTTFELARSERTAARKLAMQRDEAFFLAAEWARESGDTDAAVRHYATVVQSQPDQPLGEQALAALTTLGFVVPPPPASPAPSPSRKP